MKIERSMIDPQLRIAGYIFDKILGRTEKGFKRTHKITSLIKGVNIRGFNCSQEYIASRESGRRIRVRIFRPKNSKKDIPGILYLHGGGYAFNVPESEINTIGMFLKKRDCVIVAPDYRLSIEEPYPAALDDCYDTLDWMANNHNELGFRSNQIFTIGSSAGGGLTIALNLLARDIGKINIAYQMPLYPMIDDESSTDSMKDNDAPVWNFKRNKVAWELYLRGLGSDIPQYAAPYRCSDFSNLPPACTFIGDVDPFLDETKFYVGKLIESGTEVDFKVFKGCYHAFETVNPKADVSIEAKEYLMSRFSQAVNNRFS